MTAFDPNAASAEESGVFGLPHTPDAAGVVLVPVPFEATVSYGGGASEGPAAILRASRQVDLYDVEVGKPYEAGIAMLDDPADVRAWDLSARAAAAHVLSRGGTHGDPGLLAAAASVDAYMERMNGWVRSTVELLLSRGKIVGKEAKEIHCRFGAFFTYLSSHASISYSTCITDSRAR